MSIVLSESITQLRIGELWKYPPLRLQMHGTLRLLASFMFQTFNDPSSLAEYTSYPLGENPPIFDGPSSPCMIASGFARSHTQIVRSSAPATTAGPLGCQSIQFISAPGPSRVLKTVCGSSVFQIPIVPSILAVARYFPSKENATYMTVSV